MRQLEDGSNEPIAEPLFVGREWALERVDSWLAGPEQALLITGGPGSGKSALALRVEAINDASVRPVGEGLRAGAIAVSHTCRALDASRIDPLRFVERVSAGIANAYQPFAEALLNVGDQRIEVSGAVEASEIAPGAQAAGVLIDTVRIGQMSPELAFERAVRGPLSQVDEPPKPFVVLVDALDEALTLRADETVVDVIADALSAGNLPPTLRFLLTSRPDRRILERFLSSPRIDLVADAPVSAPATADAAQELDDVGRYAFERLALDEAQNPETTARRIAVAAAGNFLYARYVLDDALARDDFELPDADLPAGLDDWYRQYLERELARTRESWEERYRPLLGALAVARGMGLTRTQLAGTAELPESQVDDALVRLSQYVTTPGTEGPFRIYHQSFRDFLLADRQYRVYPLEANAAIARFAIEDYGNDWLGCKDAYALENVVAHLAEVIRGDTQPQFRSDALGRLGDLVTDLTYVAARARCCGAASAERDIATADELIADRVLLSSLRQHMAQIGPLVDRCPTAPDAAITLATRLAHDADLDSLVDNLVRRLSPPYLAARHPLPDLAHPGLVRALDLPSEALTCAISGGGELVAWLGGEVQIWDALTGTQLRRFTVGAPEGGALSADAQTAAFVFDQGGRLELWNCATGTGTRTLGPFGEPITACAVSADGGTVVTAGRNGTVQLWDSETGERLDAFSVTAPIGMCAVSTDASVVVCHTGTLEDWHDAEGQSRNIFYADGPLEVRFRAGDGRLSTVLGKTPVEAFALSGDGKLLVVAETSREEEEEEDGDGTDSESEASDRVPGGADRDDHVPETAQFSAFDLSSGERHAIATRESETGASCAVSFDGRVAAIADSYDQLSMWAADTGDLTLLERDHPTPVGVMALSVGGEFGVSAIENQISIWDAQSRQMRRWPEGRNTWALSPFASNSRILCAVRDGGAEVWDVDSGEPIGALGAEGAMEACAASEDGRVAVTVEWQFMSEESPVKVWNLAQDRFEHSVPAAERPIAMSRDGRLLLVNREDRRTAVWNIEEARYEDELLPAAQSGSAYAFAPDGSLAAIGYENGCLELWPALGARLTCHPGHEEHVMHVAFRSDGRTLISSSADRSVRVWDASGHQSHVFQHPGGGLPVQGCALSPDGRHAASVDMDGCLKIWQLEHEICLITQYVHGVLFDCKWLGDTTIAMAGTRGVYLLQVALGH